MPGYSGTPLYKKLGIKPGFRVLTLGAPTHFAETLGPLPEQVQLLSRARNPVEITVVFARNATDLRQRFARAKALIPRDGSIWVCWPKKSAGIKTDLSFDMVQRHGLDQGLVDNKVCAVSETFSGLRFVYRLKDRG